MGELLERNQVMNIVPQDFTHSNKGKITEIHEKGFSIELMHPPEGILPNKMIEFYSPTQNGMLYFISSVIRIEDNTLILKNPLKHRFLQRRAFSRVKVSNDIEFKASGKTYKVTSIDLSAGGMKLKTTERLDIDSEYDLTLNLKRESVSSKFEPIRIEKNDDGSYTISGRFKISSNSDKIALMQFCMKKNLENVNK